VSKKNRRKVRVDFRKNRQSRARSNKLSSDVLDDDAADRLVTDERISGKGDLSRRRTVIVDDADGELQREVDEQNCLRGRVVAAVGLQSLVKGDDGNRYECTVRRVVRTMARDARNAVVTGDHVLFRPIDVAKAAPRSQAPAWERDAGSVGHGNQGVIERVEPRRGIVSRSSQRHEHILVANVDRVVIVVSANEPPLKTNLIDRFLISAGKGDVEPIVCINKVDLAAPVELQPVVGLYAQLGYEVVTTCAVSPSDRSQGFSEIPGISRNEIHPGVRRLRALLNGRQAVLTGQSGVGKSSLLNAIQPNWDLQTGEVSNWTQKGKHTTRRAILLELDCGGWVVDTPGIRQFTLWDVLPEEVEGYFVEFRPFVTLCRFPDCSHTHESDCGVKSAVQAGQISRLRYGSYLKILAGEEE
jgi:ribosome biogenesis GTPase / thiamine phosphate phosphatase